MSNSLQHVLCVDDEMDILEIVEMSLESLGELRVTCFSSGQKALNEAIALAPDLILLDVMMPEMNGIATFKALRQMQPLNTVPIIFMTARIQSAAVTEYLAMGISAVIPKPFNPMTLPEEIKSIYTKSMNAHQ